MVTPAPRRLVVPPVRVPEAVPASHRVAIDTVVLRGPSRVAQIPAPALAAYQRAAGILEQVDHGCGIDWTVLAAVGRVLTDHGRLHDSVLGPRGRAHPSIVGDPAVDARGLALPDSDRGQVDGDPRHDRAVGPLLLTPAVWRLVAVDADSNGRRSPQNVFDASLATAVLLCAGRGDLSTAPDLRAALRRTGRGPDFVAATLRALRAYRADTTRAPATLDNPAAAPALLRLAATGTSGGEGGRDPGGAAATTLPAEAGWPAVPPAATSSAGATPTPTPAPTPTPTGTPTPTPTSTGTPSPTPSTTDTPTPTDTPTATAPATTGDPTPSGQG